MEAFCRAKNHFIDLYVPASLEEAQAHCSYLVLFALSLVGLPVNAALPEKCKQCKTNIHFLFSASVWGSSFGLLHMLY